MVAGTAAFSRQRSCVVVGMADVDVSSVAGSFEDLLASSPDAQAVRTVGLDYPGQAEDLRPLLDLALPTSDTVALATCFDYHATPIAGVGTVDGSIGSSRAGTGLRDASWSRSVSSRPATG